MKRDRTEDDGRTPIDGSNQDSSEGRGDDSADVTRDDSADGPRKGWADAATEGLSTVVAQGTFDILHPGHVHYFERAAAMGDELVVIVARRTNVDHKAPPICSGRQRRDLVDALEAVDAAVLGDEEDIFAPIEAIRPDVIALGHDQHHECDAIEAELERRGIGCAVRRVDGREPRYDDELLSTRLIVDRILEQRG